MRSPPASRRAQDPHPGNLIRTPDGRLAILDFGLMTEIKDDVKYGMVEAISHLIHRDYEAIVQDFVTLDFIPPGVDLKPILPVLSRVFDQALEGGGAKAFNFQELAADLAQITFDYPFRIPPYFALIIRAIGVLEGIALVGDPGFALVDEAYPYISKLLLTDNSPRLRAALSYMVYGKSRVFDADRLIDILESYETFTTTALSARGDAGVPAVSTTAVVKAAPAPAPAPAAAGAAGVWAAVDDQSPLPPLPPLASLPAGSSRAALAFLLSSEGEFFREFLVEEIVKGIDAQGRVQAADGLASLGLAGASLPLLLPGGWVPLRLAPRVTAEDRAVVANVQKLVGFLAGRPGGAQPFGGELQQQQAAAELLAVLPRLGAEIVPSLGSKLGSRLAARFLRDLLLTEAESDAADAAMSSALARGSPAAPPLLAAVRVAR